MYYSKIDIETAQPIELGEPSSVRVSDRLIALVMFLALPAIALGLIGRVLLRDLRSLLGGVAMWTQLYATERARRR